MKILAVDTATRNCSVAVSDNGALRAELSVGTGQTHSKHLLDLIEQTLRGAGLEIGEIDGFAVTVGPGSFTGLRIGVSSIKGLAFALDRPVVGVSSLEALAWQAVPCARPICVVLDARKGQVYFGRYRYAHGCLKTEKREQVLTPEEIGNDINEPCLFVGNGLENYRAVFQARLGRLADFAPDTLNIIRAGTVAGLARQKFQQKDTLNAAALVPHYIRKSDAELNFRKQL